MGQPRGLAQVELQRTPLLVLDVGAWLTVNFVGCQASLPPARSPPTLPALPPPILSPLAQPPCAPAAIKALSSGRGGGQTGAMDGGVGGGRVRGASSAPTHPRVTTCPVPRGAPPEGTTWIGVERGPRQKEAGEWLARPTPGPCHAPFLRPATRSCLTAAASDEGRQPQRARPAAAGWSGRDGTSPCGPREHVYTGPRPCPPGAAPRPPFL